MPLEPTANQTDPPIPASQAPKSHSEKGGWKENPSNSLLFVVVALVPLALLVLAVVAVFIWLM